MGNVEPQESSLSREDVSYVIELAKQAGLIAIAMHSGVSIEEKTGPYDRVTAADLALSKLITKGLQKRFPTDLVISEEDKNHPSQITNNRIWLVDPIDGTHNYIVNDGQYSVMIGLLENLKPVFGCVYAPTQQLTYYGGSKYGAWKTVNNNMPIGISKVDELSTHHPKRLMMGYRDKKSYPWVLKLEDIQFIKSGSVGLRIGKIFDNDADLFLHLSGHLKLWDTAAPVAIAQAAGLEVGDLELNDLSYNLDTVEHNSSVIIGRPGSLSWAQKYISKPL